MTRWTPYLSLVAMLVLLVPTTRWFGTRVQRLVLVLTSNPVAAIYVHFFLLLPGTALHELSHWLVAKALGVGTGGLSLRPRAQRGSIIRFGAVQIRQTDALRESLIGLSPLIFGTTVLVCLYKWRLGTSIGLEWSLESLPTQIALMLQVPDVGLWLYLLVAISNAMLPSASDRRAWRPLSVYSAALLALSITLALATDLSLPQRLLSLVPPLMGELAVVFAFTVVIDLSLGSCLWLLEALAGHLLGRRLQTG